MEADITQRLDAFEKRLDAVYVSVEKTRRYLLWTFIIGIVAFLLPLVGLLFAIPSFLSLYSGIGSL